MEKTNRKMASNWHFPNFQLSKIHNILNVLLSESCKTFYFSAFRKLIFVFQLSESRDSFHFHAFLKVWKWKAGKQKVGKHSPKSVLKIYSHILRTLLGLSFPAFLKVSKWKAGKQKVRKNSPKSVVIVYSLIITTLFGLCFPSFCFHAFSRDSATELMLQQFW